MRAWIDIATLAHTKNLNGGLVARSASGLPLLLEQGMELALVPPVLDAPRLVRVASVNPRTDYEALVFFEEVDSAHVADALVGSHCLARRDAIDFEAIATEGDLPSWEGWSVFDANAGFVGAVDSIEDRAMQPLLVIARAADADIDADAGTLARSVLVPLVEEFIVNVDEDAQRIDLACPAGLLDL